MSISHYDGNGVSTAVLTPSSTLASITINSSTLVIPSGSATLTATGRTSGGRIISISPTWEVDDSVNFSINPSTGQVTGNTDGHSTAVRCRVGGIVSNDCTVSCSSFSAMSTRASTILEGISSGLSSRLTPVNHMVPGQTTLTEDVTSTGAGWLVGGLTAGTLQVVDDVSAPYGKTLDLIWPAQYQSPITSFTRGTATVLVISGNTSNFTTSSKWQGANACVTGSNGHAYIALGEQDPSRGYPAADSTNEPGVGANWTSFWYDIGVRPSLSAPAWVAGSVYHIGTFFNIKNYNGTNAAYIGGGGAAGVLDPDGVTVYLAIDSTAWPTPPASGSAILRLAAGTGTAAFNEVPDATRPSTFGDVEYHCTIEKVNSGYKINDGAGGQKGVYFYWSCTSGQACGFLNQPAWATGRGSTGPGDDLGPLGMSTIIYQCDRLGGSYIASRVIGTDGQVYICYQDHVSDSTTQPVTGGSWQNFWRLDTDQSTAAAWATGTLYHGPQSLNLGGIYGDATRDVFVKVETIIRNPLTRGGDTTIWTIVNGTEIVPDGYVAYGSPWTVRINDTYNPGSDKLLAFRAVSGGADNTNGGGGDWPDVEGRNKYAEVYHARGFSYNPGTIHFSGSCEQGSSPSAASPIKFLFELTDSIGRVDVCNSWNPTFGTQQLSFTASSGTVTLVRDYTGVSGGSAGRVRLQVTGATPGVPLTVNVDLAQIANNDRFTGSHYTGSVTVTPT